MESPAKVVMPADTQEAAAEAPVSRGIETFRNLKFADPIDGSEWAITEVQYHEPELVEVAAKSKPAEETDATGKEKATRKEFGPSYLSMVRLSSEHGDKVYAIKRDAKIWNSDLAVAYMKNKLNYTLIPWEQTIAGKKAAEMETQLAQEAQLTQEAVGQNGQPEQTPTVEVERIMQAPVKGMPVAQTEKI